MDIFLSLYDKTNFVFYILFAFCVLTLFIKIFFHIISFTPAKKFPPAKKQHKFAIVIPARNESKVIARILDSIKAQTYPHDLIDTYIIVEHDDDPTCQIAKNYDRTHIFVRKHLELKGKGHAMDELFEELLKEDQGYEAYFIFDADNVLYPDFVEQMNKVYDQGYDIATSYRNSSNWNASWISACSGLTFTMLNTFDSKPKSKLGVSVNIMGTGFYISSKVLKQVGGYKFFTLTEDVEFRLYSTLKNIKTTYNEYAGFYDEQPTKFKVSCKQRLRWCKGYLQANKIYSKQLLKEGFKEGGKNGSFKLYTALGVLPLVFTVVSLLTYQLMHLGLMVYGLLIGHALWYMPLICFAGSALALYLFFVIYTTMLLIIERKRIHLKFFNAITCVLLNPIFILLYIPIYINALCKKDVEWVAIEHTGCSQVKKPSMFEKLNSSIKRLFEKNHNKDTEGEKIAK